MAHPEPTCRWQKQTAGQNLTVSVQEIDEEDHSGRGAGSTAPENRLRAAYAAR
jgi:hypothetical protein